MERINTMTNNNIKAVIFDLDGTLLNTLEDLTDSVNVALHQYGYPMRSIEEVRKFVGNGIHKLIERAVPEESTEDEIEHVFNAFREHYLVHCQDKTKPYDGIIPMLDTLNQIGYALAIVSNKADAAVKKLSADYFPKQITVAIGEKEGVKRKPAPDSVYEALRELGVAKEDAIYVGDSDVDIATAKNAGLPCISVTWGFREEAFLKTKEPDYLIHTPEEIFEILKKL